MATLQNIGKLKYRGKDGQWHPLPVVVQDAGGGVSTISGKGAPTSATQGKVNQLYRDEDTQRLYICTDTNGGYTWAAVVSDTEDAVTYTAQTLTEEQKAQARSNIGAGTSNFSGSYNDLSNKPNIPAATVIDATLTKSGQAADAKAAGDAIGKKIDKSQGTGNAGKILGIGADGNLTPQDKPAQALAGDAAPTTATAGVVGQEYYVIVGNTVTEMYVCTAVANGTYTWGKVEFGAEIDDTSTEPTKVWSAEKCNQLSEEIANLQISGLTTAQVNALDGMFKIGAYTEDASSAYATFKAAFGIADSGGETAKTLTSISAVYSGGDVTAGTAVNALTGILVTAHYSDGSAEDVTGYTLSGEIVEGSNTITVSYSGKTTTFTVTGVVESGGENNGWTDGEAYAIKWTDGYRIDNTAENATFGDAVEDSNRSVSDFLPCYGASALMLGVGVYTNYGVYFYDGSKTLMQRNSADASYPSPVPLNAYYCRVQCVTTHKATATVTPVKFAVLGETTAWEAGKYYNLSYPDVGNLNGGTGTIGSNTQNLTSGYAFCYGSTTLKFCTYMKNYRTTVCFYDERKNFISGSTVTGSAWNVPEGAKYFRHGCYNGDQYNNGMGMNNPWLILE